MFKTLVMAACFATAALSAVAQGGAASASAPSRSDMGGDRFIAGSSVSLTDAVAGDLFAAGGSIESDASVGGDAVLAGGKLRIGADVAHSVLATGGQITINGQVGRNVRAAGGQIEFAPASRIVGNVSVAGGQVNLRGAVLGHVQAAGGRVFIDGPVGGDVLAASGQVELGPNARIAGTLRYRSGDSLRQDPAAQVRGGAVQMMDAPGAAHDNPMHHREGRGWHGGPSWPWTLGLVLLAAVLLVLLPGAFSRVSTTWQTRPGMSLLLGFVLLVCAPFAAVLFIVTIVGIPLGLMTLALYLVLLPIGYVSSAIALGDWGLRRLRVGAAERLGWRIGAAAAALVALALLGAVPWLGSWVAFAALLAGLGALLLQWRLRGAAPA